MTFLLVALAWAALTAGAGCVLAGVAPRALRPVLATTTLITLAVAYVAALFHWGTP
ncbi:hypothetical protein ABZY03_08035 [Streptomyces klenkii]|uniref:hypothetical protein n=1 Tax=Streptomyces klenkii TaxID=1420899 RepID=UPI0033B511D2